MTLFPLRHLARVQEIAYQRDLLYMVGERYLVPPTGYRIITDEDLSQLPASAGEFREEDVGGAGRVGRKTNAHPGPAGDPGHGISIHGPVTCLRAEMEEQRGVGAVPAAAPSLPGFQPAPSCQRLVPPCQLPSLHLHAFHSGFGLPNS